MANSSAAATPRRKKRTAITDLSVFERAEMPASPEMERAVLGSILSNTESYYEAATAIRAEHFSLESHRRIYRAIQELDADSHPIDLVSVTEKLHERNELDGIGGAAYVSSLMRGLPYRPDINYYAAIVGSKAKLRSLIMECAAHVAAALEPDADADKVVSSLIDAGMNVAASTRRVQSYGMDEFIPDLMRSMLKIADEPAEGIIGYSLGIPKLNQITGGMQPGENVVVAGYSGDGKSLFTGQLILDNLLQGVECLVFTQEMTKEQYVRRWIPRLTEGKFPANMLRDWRDCGEIMKSELRRAEKKLLKLPLWVVDTSSITAAELSAIARAHIRKYKIKITAMDFLQLLASDGEESMFERVSRGAEVMRQIAKDTGTNTVTVSQLTWDKQGGTRKRVPNMGQLRGSGEIAQGAHIILMPFRPENAKGFLTGKDELRISKMREGGRSPLAIKLNKMVLQFEEDKQEQAVQEALGKNQDA